MHPFRRGSVVTDQGLFLNPLVSCGPELITSVIGERPALRNGFGTR